MQQPLKLPYSDTQISVSVPEGRLAFVGSLPSSSALPEWHSRLEQLLSEPTAGDSLSTCVKGANSILILVEDQTRHTPVREILPILLRYLSDCGFSDSQIRVLVCPGTHRILTDAELVEKLGEDCVRRLSILQHDYRDASCLVRLNSVEASGVLVPVCVNRAVLEADFVIGVGNIIPHSDAGFSGGGKILNPGCSGRETVSAMHLVSALMGQIPLGVMENDCRHVIEQVAKQAGLRFIINVVLNAQNEVVHLVTGDMVRAHRQGCQAALSAFCVPILQRADIVISCSNPYDCDFWQCEKALTSAYLAVKDQGIIILIAPCQEGVADNHDDFLDWMKLSYPELERRLRQADPADASVDAVAGGIAMGAALVRQRASVFLVSDGLTKKQVEDMGFVYFASAQEAIDAALTQKPDGNVGVLLRGGDCVPVLQEAED